MRAQIEEMKLIVVVLVVVVVEKDEFRLNMVNVCKYKVTN
jgi:hypothetical protein